VCPEHTLTAHTLTLAQDDEPSQGDPDSDVQLEAVKSHSSASVVKSHQKRGRGEREGERREKRERREEWREINKKKIRTEAGKQTKRKNQRKTNEEEA
jgi:hypothetical protein